MNIAINLSQMKLKILQETFHSWSTVHFLLCLDNERPQTILIWQKLLHLNHSSEHFIFTGTKQSFKLRQWHICHMIYFPLSWLKINQKSISHAHPYTGMAILHNHKSQISKFNSKLELICNVWDLQSFYLYDDLRLFKEPQMEAS